MYMIEVTAGHLVALGYVLGAVSALATVFIIMLKAAAKQRPVDRGK